MESNTEKLLVEAARCGLKWLDTNADNKGNRTWKHKILEKVCEEIIASEGKTTLFNAKDIYESPNDGDSGSQANKEFGKFGKTLESWSDSFNEIAVDNKFDVYLSGTISKRNNRNTLELTAREVDSTATVAFDKIPNDHIRYRILEHKSLPRWQQWLLNRNIGAGIHLFIASIFFLVPATLTSFTVLFAFVIINEASVFNVSIFIGVLWAEFYLLRWIYDFWHFYDRKIMMLPLSFTAIDQPPTALVMRRKKDKRWPDIQILATSANCLHCDGTVYLREENHTRFRVIGACNRHPTEHRFTFDYTRNLGRQLQD